ncbi:MAG TPA: hypothetical protein DD395_09635 [Lachnospiraceae bacterium]|nr:hypothetical protein [Lachnospiraceae bacterium]
MITTTFVAILAVILFILFLCIILAGITNGDTTMAFVGFILTLLLGFGIAVYTSSDTVTKPEVTKTVETETTKVEIDKAAEKLIALFNGEDSVEGEKSSETSEETEGVGMGTIIIIMLIIFSPALLFIGLDLIEDIIDCSSDFVGTCFLKKKKETALESIIKETDEDNPLIKKISTSKQKKEINIDKLAEKDSKIAYIVWAVNFLNDQEKENYTRKLESYYIPEIMQAYEQYQKVKSFHVKEMTAEAKKHYEKIVNLSYRVANVEVKKAAGEIVMDMDCNADVCEDIYKRDGYSSMQEEMQEPHTAEKKKEQTLYAKAISKDTYTFWTSEE